MAYLFFSINIKKIKTQKFVTFYCAIQSRDRHKVIWSPLWMTLTILKGAGSRNVNAGLLIGHITETFYCFSQNEGIILKMES